MQWLRRINKTTANQPVMNIDRNLASFKLKMIKSAKYYYNIERRELKVINRIL